MRALEPQTRFLLRGSALLAGLLALWWFLLVGPMLYLLKGAASAFIEIEEHPSGDWTLQVPIDVSVPTTAQQIQSIDFDITHGDAATFTFSLPVLWAILLAAPACKPRPLLLGTVVMAAIEVALLLAFAKITGSESAFQLAQADDAFGMVAPSRSLPNGKRAALRCTVLGCIHSSSRIARRSVRGRGAYLPTM